MNEGVLGSKTLWQQNPPVLNGVLTNMVDLYSGHKPVVCAVVSGDVKMLVVIQMDYGLGKGEQIDR